MGNVSKPQTKSGMPACSPARATRPKINGTVKDSTEVPASRLRENSKIENIASNHHAPIECVCCAEDRRCILKFPCGHLYCKSCIGTLFTMSLKDHSQIPVKCCNIAVDQSLHQLVLDKGNQQKYAEALEEIQAKKKMYW